MVFKKNDYVVLNLLDRDYIGMIYIQTRQSPNEYCVVVPAKLALLTNVPEIVLYPIYKDNISISRHCDTFTTSKPGEILYWNGDEFVNPNECNQVLFDSSKIDRKNINVKSFISSLSTSQLRDRFIELNLPIRQDTRLLSKLELQNIYEQTMLKDAEKTLKMCEAIEQSANDTCENLQKVCNKKSRLTGKRQKCEKEVKKCRSLKSLPEFGVKIKSKIQNAIDCHTNKSTNIDPNNQCEPMDSITEDISFMNTAGCPPLKLVSSIYQGVAKQFEK